MLLITLTAAQARAQSYVIEDLGGVTPRDINSLGQVAGALGMPNGHTRAFLWTDGTLKVLDPLPGDTDCEATSLNDSGKVVGISYRGPRSATTTFNGVLWGPTYTRQLNAAGGTSVEPRDINNAGVIAGRVRRGDQWQAILWTAEGVREIPGAEQAVAVNERSDVAGQTRDGFSRLWRDGVLLEIGDTEWARLRGFLEIDAVAINTGGQLAMDILDTDKQPAAYRWTDGLYLRLGQLRSGSPSWTMAKGINDAGDVVGVGAYNVGNAPVHAFLYRDSTGLVDMNTKIPAGSGWELYTASAINNRGQIVGTGSKGGFRLTPVWTLPGFLRPQ